MHVLIVSPTSPWPPSFGGAQRTLAFARALATRHRVTLTCATPVEANVGDVEAFKRQAEACLRPAIAEVLWGPPEPWHARTPAPRRSRLRVILDDLRDLATTPEPLEFREVDPAWTAAVRARAAEFDAVVVRYAHMAPVAAGIPDAKVVIDADDMRFVVLERLARTKKLTTRVSLGLEARRSRRWEAALYRRVAHVTACSPDDLAAMPGVPMTILPNGIEPEPTPHTTRDRHAIVFVGHCGWRPNIGGLRWFLGEVWPGFAAAHGEAEFRIVGRDAAAATLGVPEAERVTYAANVKSVAPWFAGAVVSVVPLFEGGGTRIKILESLAYGTPVISTRIGAAGIMEEFGEAEGLILADDAAATRAALERVLADPAPALAAAACGRERVLSRFSWSGILRELPALLERWVGR